METYRRRTHSAPEARRDSPILVRWPATGWMVTQKFFHAVEADSEGSLAGLCAAVPGGLNSARLGGSWVTFFLILCWWCFVGGDVFLGRGAAGPGMMPPDVGVVSAEDVFWTFLLVARRKGPVAVGTDSDWPGGAWALSGWFPSVAGGVLLGFASRTTRVAH